MRQRGKDNLPFAEFLASQDITPGIKANKGTVALLASTFPQNESEDRHPRVG